MDCPYSQISPELSEIVRQKSQRLTNPPGDPAIDADDFRQTLYLKLHQALPKYQPDRGKVEAFAQVAVDREAASLQRKASAEKRRSKPSSLQIVVSLPSGERIELSQAIGEKERGARLGVMKRDEADSVALIADVSGLIATLPANDQELLRWLMQKSVAEVSRDSGVPESTLHGRIQRYRQVFEAEGMREYLR